MKRRPIAIINNRNEFDSLMKIFSLLGWHTATYYSRGGFTDKVKIGVYLYRGYHSLSTCSMGNNARYPHYEIFISYEGQNDFETFIRKQECNIPDYICPKCGISGYTTQLKQLCRISDVVVVLLKKYTKKEQINLPQQFLIKTYILDIN